MTRPLSPAELFPAGVSEIATRMITLTTGVRVRVAEAGAPRGEPVIMLHGWGASIYTFRHAFAVLARAGWRVIAMDLRGHGLSDHPRGKNAYSTDAYLADLDALFDALDLSRAALVAHSMGGGIALRHALRASRRVSALALINSTNLASIPFVSLVRLSPRALVGMVGERLVSRWLVGFILRRIAYGDPSHVTERIVDEYWGTARVPGYVRAVRAAIGDFDWRPLPAVESAALEVPSVVILGASDRLLRGTRRPAECLRGAQVHVLAGGHCVHEEQPDQVYGIIGEFLRRSS